VAATVLAGNYPDFTDSALVSPPLRLPQITAGEELRATYWQWFSFDADDDARVQVSERIGPGSWSPWTDLRTHSGASGAWTLSFVDLSASADKVVRLAFRLRQTENTALPGVAEGWYLDDVVVEVR
jgi:hypothetical protein